MGPGSAGSAPRTLQALAIRVGGRGRDWGLDEDPGHPLPRGRSVVGEQMGREEAVRAAPLALLPSRRPTPVQGRGEACRGAPQPFPALQSASV